MVCGTRTEDHEGIGMLDSLTRASKNQAVIRKSLYHHE
jgi:hypothetical protein